MELLTREGNPFEPPPGGSGERSESLRSFAIDWSGDKKNGPKKVWLCEVAGGEVRRLENGRTREQIGEHLIEEARRDPGFVVGFDFAFSFPAGFLTKRGHGDVGAVWEEAERLGEEWLAECPNPPFWGKPGKKKPAFGDLLHRKTELAVGRESGRRPMSVFQIGGAGAVGVGSLRGMPVLRKLRAAGFSIWPFDEPRVSERRPLVIEIWPRLYIGNVRKARLEERVMFLEKTATSPAPFSTFSDEVRAMAEASDDAFDALVSALAMDRYSSEFARLEWAEDQAVLLEGEIWRPGVL